MKNFKQIEKCDVWPHLQAGKKVFAVLFTSRNFNERLYDLTRDWYVNQINKLLEEEDVVFYEKIEEDK